MEITEVKVVPKEGPDKKLKAYATITLDGCFVVRNIKIIKGTKGLFVAMPSRKLREACPKCNHKNPMRSRHCNQCGSAMPPPKQEPQVQDKVRQSEHRDIAHPITLECRTYIQKKVLEAYEKEEKSGPQPLEKQDVPVEKQPLPPAPPVPPAPPAPPVDEVRKIEEEGDIQL